MLRVGVGSCAKKPDEITALCIGCAEEKRNVERFRIDVLEVSIKARPKREACRPSGRKFPRETKTKRCLSKLTGNEGGFVGIEFVQFQLEPIRERVSR